MNAEYEEFLRGNEWRKFAADFKKLNNNECGLCKSSKQLDVHHISYNPDNLMDKQNVICLCRRCHANTHRMLNQYQETFPSPNFVKLDELDRLVIDCFANFYFNSYCGIDNDSKVIMLDNAEMRKLQDFILKSIECKFGKYKAIVVYTDHGIYPVEFGELTFIMKAREHVVQLRNKAIKEALNEGFDSYTIKKRFKMSDSAWIKAIRRIDGK
jgi:hypothetical protein